MNIDEKTVLVVCYGHHQAQSRVVKMGEQEDREMGVCERLLSFSASGIDGLLMATQRRSTLW